MIAADRDALICDLAETYGILDIRGLPATLLATLSSGLRENSRIKMRLSGEKLPRHILLLAAAVDRLSILVWQQTQNGQEGINAPKSIVDALMGIKSDESDLEVFDTTEDYETEWKNITGVDHYG